VTDETPTPAVGHLVARHESFHEIVELRPSLDGDLVVCATDDGNFQILASHLTPAGAVKGVRIWK
jgi:hypothetical protein